MTRDKSTVVTDNTIVMNLETTCMSKGQVGRDAIFLSSISTSWRSVSLARRVWTSSIVAVPFGWDGSGLRRG